MIIKNGECIFARQGSFVHTCLCHSTNRSPHKDLETPLLILVSSCDLSGVIVEFIEGKQAFLFILEKFLTTDSTTRCFNGFFTCILNDIHRHDSWQLKKDEPWKLTLCLHNSHNQGLFCQVPLLTKSEGLGFFWSVFHVAFYEYLPPVIEIVDAGYHTKPALHKKTKTNPPHDNNKNTPIFTPFSLQLRIPLRVVSSENHHHQPFISLLSVSLFITEESLSQ